MSSTRTPSPDEIGRARHTKAQLAAWGVSWPPPKGWRRELERRWHASQNFSPPAEPTNDAPSAWWWTISRGGPCHECREQTKGGRIAFESSTRAVLCESCADATGVAAECRESKKARAARKRRQATPKVPSLPERGPTIDQLNEVQRLRDVTGINCERPHNYEEAERQLGALRAYDADRQLENAPAGKARA